MPRRHGNASLVRGVATAFAVIALAACSSPRTPEPSETSFRPSPSPLSSESGATRPPWIDELQNVLDDDSGFLGDEARATLTEARRTGVITRDQVDGAAEVAAACMEDAGLVPVFSRPELDFVGYGISWSFDVGDGPDEARADEFDALGSACLAKHFDAVEFFYLQQPIAVAAQDLADNAHFESIRDALYECLEPTPFHVDRAAPKAEMYGQAVADFGERGMDSCYVTSGLVDLGS